MWGNRFRILKSKTRHLRSLCFFKRKKIGKWNWHRNFKSHKQTAYTSNCCRFTWSTSTFFLRFFSLLHQYSWFIPCCVSKSNLHVYTHIFYIEQRDLSTLATDGNIIKRWISYICWDGLWFLIYRLRGQLSSSCTTITV